MRAAGNKGMAAEMLVLGEDLAIKVDMLRRRVRISRGNRTSFTSSLRVGSNFTEVARLPLRLATEAARCASKSAIARLMSDDDLRSETSFWNE